VQFLSHLNFQEALLSSPVYNVENVAHRIGEVTCPSTRGRFEALQLKAMVSMVSFCKVSENL
jgi:hypothetical protein